MNNTIHKKVAAWVCIHSFLERINFFYICLAPMLVWSNTDYSLIGYALMLHELAKIITDYPAGTLGDRVNPLFIILIGIALKGIALLLIGTLGTPTAILVGAFLIGVGRGFMYSKAEPFAFSILKNTNGEKSFSKILMYRVAVSNVAAVFIGLSFPFLTEKIGFSRIMLANAGIYFVIYIPLLAILAALIPHSTKSSEVLLSQKTNLIEIIKSGKLSKKLVWMCIMYGFFGSSFFFITDIQKTLIVSLGFSKTQIGNTYIIAHIVPALASLYFSIKPNTTSRSPVIILQFLCLFLGLLTLSSCFSNFRNTIITKYILVGSGVCFFTSIHLLSSAIMGKIMLQITKDQTENKRFSISSMANTFTSAFNVLVFTIFGILSKNIAVNVSAPIIYATTLLCFITLLVPINKL